MNDCGWLSDTMEGSKKGYAPPVYPLGQHDSYPPQQPSYDPNYPVAPQTGYPHAAQQYTTTNVAVVQSQPQPAPRPTTNARRIGKNDNGLVFPSWPVSSPSVAADGSRSRAPLRLSFWRSRHKKVRTPETRRK